MSLRLDHVSKIVGRETHIDDVSLTCEPGSFNVLLGATRAGKTSLLRLMAGLDRPSQGRILVDDRDVTGVPVRKRNLAMVYQQFINYPSLTVYKNIASPLKLARLPRKEIDRRVRAEAERLRIEHLLDRLPSELSGGQQQRTAIARALVRDAGLLLLDEPLVNLDYKLREALRVELRELFTEREAVVVYATADPQEALALGGQTAVMHEGRLIQYGPTPAVYRRPASVAVSQVFSDPPMNLLEARLSGGRLSFGSDLSVAAPAHFHPLADGDYRVGLRPAHTRLARENGEDLEVTGSVDVAEISGSATFVHLHRERLMLVLEAEGVHGLSPGQPLQVYLPPRRLYAFGGDGRLLAAPGGA